MKDVNKALAFLQEIHPLKQIGNYYHFECGYCHQPQGRSGHCHPDTLTMKCYQSGCKFDSWVSVYDYLAFMTGKHVTEVRKQVGESLKSFEYSPGLKLFNQSTARLPESTPVIQNTGTYYKQAVKYLKGRGFDPQELWDKYSVCYTGFKNGYGWDQRIIVPFLDYRGLLTYYQGRDYTGLSVLRWMNPKNEDVPRGKSHVLYNERVLLHPSPCFVQEGIFDVWEMENAVGVSGKSPSPTQLIKFNNSLSTEFLVAFDPGAWLDTLNTGYSLLFTGRPVKLVELTVGDANDIGQAEVLKLAEKAVELSYDTYDDELSRVEYGRTRKTLGKTFRGKKKTTITLWN